MEYQKTLVDLVNVALKAKSTAIAVRIYLKNRKLQVIDNGIGIPNDILDNIDKYHKTDHSLRAIPDEYKYGRKVFCNIRNITSALIIMSRYQYFMDTYLKVFKVDFSSEVQKIQDRPTCGSTYTVYFHSQVNNIDKKLNLNEIKKIIKYLSKKHPEVSFSIRSDDEKIIIGRKKSTRKVLSKKVKYNLKKTYYLTTYSSTTFQMTNSSIASRDNIFGVRKKPSFFHYPNYFLSKTYVSEKEYRRRNQSKAFKLKTEVASVAASNDKKNKNSYHSYSNNHVMSIVNSTFNGSNNCNNIIDNNDYIINKNNYNNSNSNVSEIQILDYTAVNTRSYNELNIDNNNNNNNNDNGDNDARNEIIEDKISIGIDSYDFNVSGEWSDWILESPPNKRLQELEENKSRFKIISTRRYSFLPDKLNKLLRENNKLLIRQLSTDFREKCNFNFNLPRRQDDYVRLCNVKRGMYEITMDRKLLKQIKVLNQVNFEFIACIAEQPNKKLLILIDQHAMDERIRYENLIDDYKTEDNKLLSVTLRRSIKITELPGNYYNLLLFHRNLLTNFGINISDNNDYSDNTKTYENETQLSLSTVPKCLFKKKHSNHVDLINSMRKLLIEIAERINNNIGINSLPLTIHNAIASEACHGAIKFGDPLNIQQCNDLVSYWIETNLPNRCAHGRPAVIPLLFIDSLDKSKHNLTKKPLNFDSLNQHRYKNLTSTECKKRHNRQLGLDTALSFSPIVEALEEITSIFNDVFFEDEENDKNDKTDEKEESTDDYEDTETKEYFTDSLQWFPFFNNFLTYMMSNVIVDNNIIPIIN